jgi:hypothetical protein
MCFFRGWRPVYTLVSVVSLPNLLLHRMLPVRHTIYATTAHLPIRGPRPMTQEEMATDVLHSLRSHSLTDPGGLPTRPLSVAFADARILN